MKKLEQAARALLAHWDTPAWKYLKPTGDLMADLREALAKLDIEEMTLTQIAARHEQAEQAPVAEALRLSEEAIEYARRGGKIGSGIYGKALAAIRSAKEPQITTPDVCGEVCARAKLCYGCNKNLEEANAKFAQRAEQEPVAWRCKHCNTDMPTEHASDCPIERFGLPNEYAAPVRTKDLTDDEIAAVTGYRKSGATWPVVEEVARAVIAADREKNK